MLNTIHLQTFVAVVDAGNYSSAARMLHMTQPAVSQHIHVLEQQLGDVRLFRRVGQRMVLTLAGEQLLSATRELLAMADQTEEKIRALRGQIAGRIVIGRTLALGERVLPALLAMFRAAFPLVTVALLIGQSEALIEQVLSHQLDLALVSEQQRRRGLQTHQLGREEVLVVASPGHWLHAQDVVQPGMLREMPMIIPSPTMPLRRTIEEALRRRGETVPALQVVLETDDVLTALQAARNGMGITFAPATVFACCSAGLAPVPVQGLNLVQEWHLVRARDRELSRAVRELVDMIIGPQGLGVLGQEGLRVVER